ncbi:MAG: succinylglutamate desuccinylase/aspartoacylase family protein [Deltaproteobacteria bacterium]|nr:succinylglutamate desuccinylase/aspartoacylase family protein [Deltaproteobacteria bacterium]
MVDSPAPGRIFPRLLGSYGGDSAGPLIIGIGGMHGNEPAGAVALQRALEILRAHDVPFRGALVGFAGNRAALARGARYVDEDFNRAWSQERVRRVRAGVSSTDMTAEQREQRELLAGLDDQLAQRRGPVVCLDLHTTSAAGTPFVVIGDTLLNRRFGFRLRAPVVLGLEERLESTILNYLGEEGYVAVGFEGGQHESPTAVAIHLAAIRTVLATAGCIRAQDFPLPDDGLVPYEEETDGFPPVVEVRHHHVIRDGDEFVMEPGFTNFQPVERGRLLARDRRGPIRASESGQILMPLYQGQGTDGFFLVRRVRPFWLRVAKWLRRLRIERLLPALPGVRRYRDTPGTLVVDPRVARWFVVELFHLLGFRKRQSREGKLIVSRRWHESHAFDELPGP